MRGDGEVIQPAFDQSIDRVTIFIQRQMMHRGPVSSQQVIVEHINKHSGIPSAIGRDSRAAPPEGWMRLRKDINGAMQGDALCQIVRQYARQGAFDPVPDNSSHYQSRMVTCQQCMGQEVQWSSSGTAVLRLFTLRKR